MIHSIEILESEAEHLYDIRVDGYVHKRHRHMTEDAMEGCVKFLRTYYSNVGERYRVTRPMVVV